MNDHHTGNALKRRDSIKIRYITRIIIDRIEDLMSTCSLLDYIYSHEIYDISYSHTILHSMLHSCVESGIVIP